MLNITPCQPTIGKVELVLNDVFKLSRMIGTFPIDKEYSCISKYNLTKGLTLYVLATIVISASTSRESYDDVLKLDRKRYTLHTIFTVIFHFINLANLVGNRGLVKKIYDELKDIEYILWKSGIDWYYRPSWCIKYLGFTCMVICHAMWEIFYNRWENMRLRIPLHITYPALFSITSQYLALLQVCLSILKQIRITEDNGTVVKLNDKISSFCQNVNTLYGPQLFFYVVNLFLVNLFSIYIKIIQRVAINIVTICWIGIYTGPLLAMTIYAGYISEEVLRPFNITRHVNMKKKY